MKITLYLRGLKCKTQIATSFVPKPLLCTQIPIIRPTLQNKIVSEMMWKTPEVHQFSAVWATRGPAIKARVLPRTAQARSGMGPGYWTCDLWWNRQAMAWMIHVSINIYLYLYICADQERIYDYVLFFFLLRLIFVAGFYYNFGID